jgi:hypothetical protein
VEAHFRVVSPVVRAVEAVDSLVEAASRVVREVDSLMDVTDSKHRRKIQDIWN